MFYNVLDVEFFAQAGIQFTHARFDFSSQLGESINPLQQFTTKLLLRSFRKRGGFCHREFERLHHEKSIAEVVAPFDQNAARVLLVYEVNISSLKKWIMIRVMPYRHTENVARRLTERREAIVAAARALAAESGMAEVQIAPVAARAGIAAGTVYRYFPSKTELVGAVMAAVSERELAAMRAAADAAPGPLSALAAAVTTFAGRALQRRRLAWATIAEPVEPDIDAMRLAYRQALAGELEKRLAACIHAGHLAEQDVRLSAAALVGALAEGLLGPLAPDAPTPAGARAAVQAITLFALRGVGIVDARARGLVVQSAMPETDEG